MGVFFSLKYDNNTIFKMLKRQLYNHENMHRVWFLLSLSFPRTRCHAVSPSPMKWCPLSIWMNPAPLSFPPCSWPAAVAVGWATLRILARSRLSWVCGMNRLAFIHTSKEQKIISTILFSYKRCFCRLSFPFKIESAFSTGSRNQSKSGLSIKTGVLESWTIIVQLI